MLVLSVLLLQLLPGFTSVNLDKAQARSTSACAGSMNVSPQEKREVVWTAASRLETVETLETTMANHKKAHQAVDTGAEACRSMAP